MKITLFYSILPGPNYMIQTESSNQQSSPTGQLIMFINNTENELNIMPTILKSSFQEQTFEATCLLVMQKKHELFSALCNCYSAEPPKPLFIKYKSVQGQSRQVKDPVSDKELMFSRAPALFTNC